MGQKSAVCESIEPPGSSTSLSSLAKKTFEHPVHEQLSLFTANTSVNPGITASVADKGSDPRVPGKPVNAGTAGFRERFFSAATAVEWNDWMWQMRNRIRSLAELTHFLELSPEEKAVDRSSGISLPMAITPYYLSLFYDRDSCAPLRKSMVPQVFETLYSPAEAQDPLGEEAQSPVEGLVHRYPDRALLLVTTTCSNYCRYCTRSRVVGNSERHALPQIDRWKNALAYIGAHPEIRDVLVSGGDPLLLSDDQLQWLLGNLRKIPHVEMIRIGTKAPMALPQRITPHLVKMLRKYHPLFMSIHATHPDEITPESSEACTRLADAGIPLGSQTVLLAGVNDSAVTMRTLMHKLLTIRVRPYYLYQCDPILGSGHFRTPVHAGIDIINSLRGFTSGYAVPTFVIDAPGGGGKIPVMPEYVLSRENDEVVLRNFNNDRFVYPDEKGRAVACSGTFREGDGI